MTLSRQFPMIWRFEDEAFPQECLKELEEIAPEEAAALWQRWVHPTAEHLMLIPAGEDGDRTRLDGEWDHPDATRAALAEHLRLDSAVSIEVFWGPRTAIRTTWGVFLTEWDNFLYPSDDNDALVIGDGEVVIVYVEDVFWIRLLRAHSNA